MEKGDKFPLTIMRDGKKIVIGECELVEGDDPSTLMVEGTITDPELAKELADIDYDHFSMETGILRNVFDDKDTN